VFPFDSELPTGQLRDHVQSCVAGLAPFPVRLSQVTGSEGEYLFLNIKRGNDELIALHDRLYTGPLERLLGGAGVFADPELADRHSRLRAVHVPDRRRRPERIELVTTLARS
jgi:hypothetical protein